MAEQQNPGRIKAKVKLTATKIHGPNSPDVKSGRVPLNHRESVETEGEQFVELTEDDVRGILGDEVADAWFHPQGRMNE
jgi:hypothetical protein